VFLKEIGSWMADPKLPPSVQERWFDIWERVDPGITSKVGSIAASMFSRVPANRVQEAEMGADVPACLHAWSMVQLQQGDANAWLALKSVPASCVGTLSLLLRATSLCCHPCCLSACENKQCCLCCLQP
jgi:hypothetical protein